MSRSRPHPAWLVRRRYFKRVGRWVKPRRRPEAEPGEPVRSSNVVPFPEVAKGSRRLQDVPARGVESA